MNKRSVTPGLVLIIIGVLAVVCYSMLSELLETPANGSGPLIISRLVNSIPLVILTVLTAITLAVMLVNCFMLYLVFRPGAVTRADHLPTGAGDELIVARVTGDFFLERTMKRFQNVPAVLTTMEDGDFVLLSNIDASPTFFGIKTRNLSGYWLIAIGQQELEAAPLHAGVIGDGHRILMRQDRLGHRQPRRGLVALAQSEHTDGLGAVVAQAERGIGRQIGEAAFRKRSGSAAIDRESGLAGQPVVEMLDAGLGEGLAHQRPGRRQFAQHADGLGPLSRKNDGDRFAHGRIRGGNKRFRNAPTPCPR